MRDDEPEMRWGLRLGLGRSLMVALVVGIASGCATPPTAGPSRASTVSPTASPTTAVIGEPIGVAVIGHSGATGYDSDPEQPGQDVEANSWATGSNPAVQSIYQRLIAQDPTVQGHATNLALDGSGVDSLIAQATELVKRNPPPKLVLIQTIDNDIKCDRSDAANFEPYRMKLTQALGILAAGLPKSKILIVSQWATVKVYDRVVFAVSATHLMGDGPCDTVDAGGAIVASKEAYLQGLVDDYWAIVTKACGLIATCRTDGGAMQRIDLVAADLAPDFNHLSVAGHAKMAAIVWRVLSAGG